MKYSKMIINSYEYICKVTNTDEIWDTWIFLLQREEESHIYKLHILLPQERLLHFYWFYGKEANDQW